MHVFNSTEKISKTLEMNAFENFMKVIKAYYGQVIYEQVAAQIN